MDTINIINNFDQNILMENLLISNQQKLLDLVIIVFEEDFAEKSVKDDLTIEYVKEYFNTLNFINWELFIRLLNLKTTFTYKVSTLICDIRSDSIVYLIMTIGKKSFENKSTKLIEFLLKFLKDIVDWKTCTYIRKVSMLFLLLCYEKIYTNTTLINEILESNLFDKNMWNDSKYCNRLHVIYNIFNIPIHREKFTPIDILIDKCSDEVIIKAIDLGIINFDKNNLDKIKSEKVILYLIEKQSIILDNDVFYIAVRNNWVHIFEYYFSHGFIDWKYLNGSYVIFWLGYYKHYQYASDVLYQSSTKFLSNLEKGMDKYYLDDVEIDNNYNVVEQIEIYDDKKKN